MSPKLYEKIYARYRNTVLRFNERNHVQFALSSRQPAVSKKCVIGTFHKTGTVLAYNLFGQFCFLAKTPIWYSNSYPAEPKDWMAVINHHSNFEAIGVDPSKFNTVIFVRDPRDVILSSVKYHQKSSESWLHVPRKEFGGKTYQEKLTSLPNTSQKIAFEIDHYAGETISRMVSAKENPLHERTLFIKLDKLMSDRTLQPYLEMFTHLEINPTFLPLALSLAYRNSVFRKNFKSSHVTSGRHELWKTEFSDEVRGIYESRFPHAAKLLGYEDCS